MLLSATELYEAVQMALTAVKSNKFRSFLTILGVMIGVAAVISMASVIDGLDQAANEEIDQLGNNIIMVSKYPPNTNFDELTDEERNRPGITVGEAYAILDNCPSVEGVAPHNYYFQPGGNVAKYKNRKFNDPMFNGTWPDFVMVRDKEMREGRFFSDTELQFRQMVCVLGAKVADVLFPGEEAVGKVIRANGDEFTVVGVMAPMKSNFGNDFDDRKVCIPLTTYSKLIPWEKELSLDVRAKSLDLLDQAQEEIISALRIYRKVPFDKPNNFGLATQEQFKDEAESVTNIIYVIMTVITSVGLMVGGIGVMNIMLVSVTERTREIGVRKALGAKRNNIVFQFLTEAMSLSGLGGVVGIGFGIVVGMVINMMLGFPVSVPIFWVVVGFIVSVSVGLISGVYPAFKASRLDPIEALRYE